MRTGRRAAAAWLASALAAGLALRLWGLDFGFPLLVHADEGVIVQHAAAAGAGRLDPGWYVQGPLASWLLAALWGIRFALLRATGEVAGTDAYKDAFLTDPTPFYLWGRAALGTLLGTFSVWTTWRIGRETLGRPVAALGAFLFAVSFLAVRDAHFIYVDMGMLACLTLCAACWLRYARTGAVRPLVLGAVACGAAAAFKYNAALVGLLLVAVALTGHPKRWGHLALGTLVACATLVLGNPFLLLNPSGVWADLAGEGAKHGAHPWGHHFAYSFAGGAGWPVAILGALACLAALARGNRRERLLWVIPLLWYAYATRHALAYARYVLPILPFGCLGASQILSRALPRGRRRVLLPAAVLLAAAPTAAKSILFDRLLARPDARVELATWLQDSPGVRDGARLALDHTFWTTGALPTWAFGRTDAQLTGMEALADTEPQRDRLRRLRRIGEGLGRRRFTLHFLLQDGEDDAVLPLFGRPALPMRPEKLSGAGIDFLVVSGMRDGSGWERLAPLLEEARPIFEVHTGAAERGPEGAIEGLENAGLPFLWTDISSRRCLGVDLDVYRWREVDPNR